MPKPQTAAVNLVTELRETLPKATMYEISKQAVGLLSLALAQSFHMDAARIDDGSDEAWHIGDKEGVEGAQIGIVPLNW